jgi:pimeloyl-ACP methyl ester carboxylesterase
MTRHPPAEEFTTMTQPTVVLVHGAFADASTYAPVTRALLDAGITVLAPAVPNRGLLSDAREIRFVVERVGGPVLLVGHSYGGAVITVAGAAENVVGLVHLAGYALEEGESLGELQGGFPDSDLPTALVQTDVPASVAGEARVDVTVAPERFGPVIGAATLRGRRRQLVAPGHDGRGEGSLRRCGGVLADGFHGGPRTDRDSRPGHAR